jgi:Fe-S-cluster containining protein
MAQENGSSWQETPSPCVSCGACCAYFRVVFYWREAEKQGNPQCSATPVQLTEDLDAFRRVMKGTNQKNSAQCIALRGRIGKQVGCSIYANRPSPCRDFQSSYADGKPNKRCDEARKAHGLKPLKLGHQRGSQENRRENEILESARELP